MLITKQHLVVLLCLAADILAGKVNYVGYYTGNALDPSNIGRSPKAVQMPDEKAEAILENMVTWSHGAYEATQGKRGTVNVVNKDPVPGINAARDVVADMQRVVMLNYVARSKSHSPEPGSSHGQRSRSPGKSRRALYKRHQPQGRGSRRVYRRSN